MHADENRRKLLRRVLVFLLPALFLSYVFGVAMKYPLNDPDVWWHLKTGEYIVKHWEVPKADPFAYTTAVPLDDIKKIGLRSHWLGQVALYLSSRAGGLMGVGVLRTLLIVLPMLIIYIWLIRAGLGPWPSLAVISFPAFALGSQLFYAFERPQGFSFTFALLAVMVLEKLRREPAGPGGRPRLYPFVLPPLMALWANMHAGFIVGDTVIMAYLASEAMRSAYFRLRGEPHRGARPLFFVICLASIAASFLNPNTYHVFYSYLAGLATMFFRDIFRTGPAGGSGWVGNVVLEYRPLIYFYKVLGYKWFMFYWIFSGFLLVLMAGKYILRKKVDITEVVVVGFFMFFSNYYARGLMFALTVLPLFVGSSLAEIRLPQAKFRVFFKAATAFAVAITLSLFTYSYHWRPYLLKPGVSKYWITPWYPVTMVKFIRYNRIKGPMYNFYTWGGFLIWSLYPEYKVFVDGRALDEKVNMTADRILKTYPGWREKLDAYNINFIVIPVVFRESGYIVPLATALSQDGKWQLIFIGENSAVFVRDVPENGRLVEKYRVDKKSIFTEIIKVENVLLMTMPGNPAYELGKADALFALGRYEEAKVLYARHPAQASMELQNLRMMGY
jgi:hypothetical protein